MADKDRKKKKRKQKQKQIKQLKSNQTAREKGWFLFEDACFFFAAGKIEKAVKAVRRAAKVLPKEKEVIHFMGLVGQDTGQEQLELDAILLLEKIEPLAPEMRISKVIKLVSLEKYSECLNEVKQLIHDFPGFDIKGKRKELSRLKEIKAYCEDMLEFKQYEKMIQEQIEEQGKIHRRQHTRKAAVQTAHKDPDSSATPLNDIGDTEPEQVPMTIRIDTKSFEKLMFNPEPVSKDDYELALMSHEIMFAESFETLICLPGLTQVTSFWYQEETAKKVLKQYRGRALLSDEVGLGKTIEALIVLAEYIQRGMVKTALVLTPTPLVSQWRDEMQSKFNMTVPSTDDPRFKSGDKSFWKQPVVVASINQAKSKKNIDFITSREYDLIIVDEAHHLKNRNTLNFKLVNSLKKRFILLLTATPVENNLMELYNLITLLKPGQLETATSFRERFMKRGDPTDPQNREKLRELLGQVMIRNTRALAGIHIPPRFAQTIRIEPTTAETEFYSRLQDLVKLLNTHKQGRARMVIKILLAQAGSSPNAVASTLDNMLKKNDLLLDHAADIRTVKNLCRTTVDTPKNKALLKLLQATKEKVIVFVKYIGTLEHLAEFLEWNRIGFSLFHGGMTNREKDTAIQDFREKHQVLVTTEIGGEGRNLQFCSRMVNYDLPWNPMKIEQRIGRIHRIGQEKEVHIYNFCASGSIEDYILDILDRKINMFEMVIGEIDMILGRVRGEKDFSDIVCELWLETEPGQDRQKSFDNLGTRLKRAKTGYEKTRQLDDKLFGDTYEL